MLFHKKLVVAIVMLVAHSMYASQENQQGFDQIQSNKAMLVRSSVKERSVAELSDQLKKRKESDITYDITLDSMPSEMIGKILGYLSDQVGMQGFINEADIPVIIKNVHRLGSVNKKLKTEVHSVMATNILIESLALRFQMTPLDVAVLIKTEGAQAWLRKYVHESGDYELFKVVQQILSISREVCKQLEPYGIPIRDMQATKSRLSPHCNQTQQGLMLEINDVPQALCTPWGKVQLLVYDSYFRLQQKCMDSEKFKNSLESVERADNLKRMDCAIVSQEFLKKMTAYFEGILVRGLLHSGSCCSYYQQQKEVILNSMQEQSFDDYFRKISENTIAMKKGQQVLITKGCYGASSLYAINEFNGKRLPQAKWLPTQEYRNSQAVKAIWEIMHEEFYGQPEEIKKACSSSDAMYKKTKKPDYDFLDLSVATIQDIITQYAQLTRRVLIKSDDSFVEKLSYENIYDFRILNLLIDNVNRLSKKERWHSRSNESKLYFSGGAQSKSLEMLESKYQEIILTLQSGWQQAKLLDNKDILHTESEEEWLLFLKKKELLEEGRFMRTLALKLKIDKKISCHDHWKNKNQSLNNQHYNEMYLWIRKDAIDEVKNILGLELYLRENNV